MAKSKNKTPELNIVILNYQTDSYILDLIDSFTPSHRFVITIVDNSTTDSLSSSLPVRSDIRYIYNGANLGFSAGNNIGVLAQPADWYLLLNSDTMTDTDTILKLLDNHKSHDAFVGTCRLVARDGTIQNNVGYFDSLARHPLNYIFARPRFVDVSYLESSDQFDLLTGALMLIHSTVFERLGYLDSDNFFMYLEDMDFSMRLYQSGISVSYDPSIIITHFGGGSSTNARVKNQLYTNSLYNYLCKHRGVLIATLNKYLKVLR